MRDEPLIFVHLKLVAKVCLAAGCIAVLALVVSLSFLAGPSNASYEAIIRHNSITQEEIGPLMLLAGLTLVALVAVLTWMIALYSSFRIAGPLYRFTQHFRQVTARGGRDLPSLRRGDSLRRQDLAIREAVARLTEHHAAIDRLSWHASRALEEGNAEAYMKAVADLRVLDEQVRL